MNEVSVHSALQPVTPGTNQFIKNSILKVRNLLYSGDITMHVNMD